MKETMLQFFLKFLSEKYAAILADAIMYTLKGMFCVFVVVLLLIIIAALLNKLSLVSENKDN